MSTRNSFCDDNTTIEHVPLSKFFTVTPNRTPEDPRLSWSAKGLLWYILSRPDNWKIYSKQLASIYSGEKKGNGRDAIRRILNELKKAGYVEYFKKQNDIGRWIHCYKVYSMPIEDFKKLSSLQTSDTTIRGQNLKKEIPEPDDPGLDDPFLYQERNPTSTDRNKKGIYKKESIPPTPKTVKSTSSETTSPAKSTVPPSASAAQASIPSHRENLEERADFDYLSAPEVMEIADMEERTKPYFRPEIVSGWIRKWGPKVVLDLIRFFFKIKETQKVPIRKPEAWMEDGFKRQYARLDKNCEVNKAFAEKMKKQYLLKSLKIQKSYCINTEKDDQYSYSLPPETFQQIIQRLAENEQ